MCVCCCVFEHFPARKYAFTLHRCLNTNEPTGMVVCERLCVWPTGWLAGCGSNEIKISSARRFVLHFLVFHRQPCVSAYSNPQHTHTHTLDILSVARPNWTEHHMTHNNTQHSLMATWIVDTNNSLRRTDNPSIYIRAGRRWEPRGGMVAIDVYD